jgi:hypothetical protein
MIYEGMTFFIAAVLLGGESTWLFAVTFALSYLAAVSLPLLLFLRTDKPAGWMLFLLIPVSLLLFYFGTGIPALSAAILGIALVWRCSVNWIESIKNDAEKIFIITLVAVLILSFVYNEGRATALLAAGCLQGCSLLLLKMSYQWTVAGRKLAAKELKFAGILIGAAAAAGMLVTIFKIIFAGALTSIFHILNFAIIMPLYKLLTYFPFLINWCDELEREM